MASPLVSIVVPVYNAGILVSDFIASIAKQTYKNWEMILVDDGSTDNTFDYIGSFLKKDKRILFVKRSLDEPKGSLTCRNIGMSLAHGKYIIHFDADDLVNKSCLEQRIAFMEANRTLDFAIFKGGSFFYDEFGKCHRTNRSWGIPKKKGDIESFLMNDYPFSVWNVIYRGSKFKNVLWDQNVKIYTDFSYIIPTLLGDYKYEYCTSFDSDYFYRVNQKNAMTSNFSSKEKYESTKYLFEKTIKLIEPLEKKAIYRKALKCYFVDQMERVANSHNYSMILDFKNFFEINYGKNIRVSLFCTLSKIPFVMNNRRFIRLLMALLFKPNLWVKWVKSKI